MLRVFAPRPGAGSAIMVDRRGRASVPAQRLKASSVTLAAVLALTVATPTDNLGSSFGSVRVAAAAAMAGAADAIQRRSPGIRRIVRWIKGSPVYARPVVRAAPRIRRPAARAAAPILPAPLTPPPPAAPLGLEQDELAFGPVTIGPLPFYDLSEACDCAFVYLPPERGPGAIIIGGGGGGGGVLVPPIGPPVGPPIRPPAIPEASTWAMMIMGFAFIGTAWRRRRQIVRLLVKALPLRLSYTGVRVPALISPRAG